MPPQVFQSEAAPHQNLLPCVKGTASRNFALWGRILVQGVLLQGVDCFFELFVKHAQLYIDGT